MRPDCGGKAGCLTPNEHPTLIGHYSPLATDRLSPRSRKDIRVPHRIPSDASTSTASTKDKIPTFVTKRGSRSKPDDPEGIKGLFGNTNVSMAQPMLGKATDNKELLAAEDLKPDPAQTTYQRDYEIWRSLDDDENASLVSGRTRSKHSASVRDDHSQSTYRTNSDKNSLALELSSVRSGGSQLTARALERMEAIAEERDRTAAVESMKPAPGKLVFGSPRVDGNIMPPATNPQTGSKLRPQHQHLYLPLEEQLKRLIPNFTPVTSAPASDRSHYAEADARARKYARERAKASLSESGSQTARGYKDKEMRVRLETSKMFAARPIGTEGKSGQDLLNELDAAREARKQNGVRKAMGSAQTQAERIAPFSKEAAEALARAAQEEVRSEKMPVRRLGQKNLASVLRAGWVGEEHVDRALKSRSPSQGGANVETQIILSPGLLKARMMAREERQRRRCHGGVETPRPSPCAKAFTSIQTMSMQGYDYRVKNGLVPREGRPWRYTPPPKPYTPPTPAHLNTTPRSKKSDVMRVVSAA